MESESWRYRDLRLKALSKGRYTNDLIFTPSLSLRMFAYWFAQVNVDSENDNFLLFNAYNIIIGELICPTYHSSIVAFVRRVDFCHTIKRLLDHAFP